MCSCPPSKGGAGRNSLNFFLLPYPSSFCHPFHREARWAGSLLSWLWGTQTEAPWKLPECAGHCNRDKTLSGPEIKSWAFHEGYGWPLVRDTGTSVARNLTNWGPWMSAQRRKEKGREGLWNLFKRLRWHHSNGGTQVSKQESPGILRHNCYPAQAT
jgi:hypothetical protein